MDIDQCHSELLSDHLLSVPKGDRWLIFQRLQELDIPCNCPADGSLRVTAQSPHALLQVRSVLQQFTAPRQQLVSWLHYCWNAA